MTLTDTSRGGHHITRITAAATVLLLFPFAPMVWSQEIGDVGKGLVYAERICADCHAVRNSNAVSPNPEAPPFNVIAATPGMNERALTVFLQTPHRNMPNIVVPREDKYNLIAYIVSLRPRK